MCFVRFRLVSLDPPKNGRREDSSVSSTPTLTRIARWDEAFVCLGWNRLGSGPNSCCATTSPLKYSTKYFPPGEMNPALLFEKGF